MTLLMENSMLVAPNCAHRCDEALTGVLIGTAVGDSLGLPMEGLSRRRQRALFPGPLRQRLIGPFGMVSDDTEHTLLVAQALLEFPDDSTAFQRRLAHRMKWWLASLPAGVGFATLRAILRLWIGVPPIRSGVMSAGNGPAMRSALLGVYFVGDDRKRSEFVRASAELTHRDVRASIAALAVAEVAAWMTGESEDTGSLLGSMLERIAEHVEWRSVVANLRSALALRESVPEFAGRVGAIDGVSGYALQSVPVAIYAAVRHRDDFATALSEAIGCAGDTDTVGAMTGALVGDTRRHVAGIRRSWRESIIDFPCSPALLQRVAEKLSRQIAEDTTLGPVRYCCWPAVPMRNLIFLGIVLAHGLRRLLPPY